jgi:hydrogenase maturation protease
MSDRATRLLVLGLGNVLLSDDGVGPAAIALLQAGHQPPDGVLVLDGGTLGLTLLSYIEDAAAVVLVDAIKADAPAGTLVRLDGDEVGPAVATRLSPHQVGVADILEGARWHGRQPPRIVLLGIVPDTFELGVGLSPAVGAAIPTLVQQVLDEARAIGFPFINQAQESAGPFLDVARLALGAAQ